MFFSKSGEFSAIISLALFLFLSVLSFWYSHYMHIGSLSDAQHFSKTLFIFFILFSLFFSLHIYQSILKFAKSYSANSYLLLSPSSECFNNTLQLQNIYLVHFFFQSSPADTFSIHFLERGEGAREGEREGERKKDT